MKVKIFTRMYSSGVCIFLFYLIVCTDIGNAASVRRNKDDHGVDVGHEAIISGSNVTYLKSNILYPEEVLTCPCSGSNTTRYSIPTWRFKSITYHDEDELRNAIAEDMANRNSSKSSMNNGTIVHCNLLSEKSLCQAEIILSFTDTIPLLGSSFPSIYLIIAICQIFIVLLLFLNRRYGFTLFDVYLYIRDNRCRSNKVRKDFDAYISFAKGEDEYVSRSFACALQHKYKYNFYSDFEAIFDRHQGFTQKFNENIEHCKKIILVVTSSYLSFEWCRDDLASGLRKIVDLQIPVILVMSDKIAWEQFENAEKIIPLLEQIHIPLVQNKKSEIENLKKLRLFLSPPNTKRERYFIYDPFKYQKGRKNHKLGVQEEHIQEEVTTRLYSPQSDEISLTSSRDSIIV